MAHTFGNLLTHVIFSTKDRQSLIAPDLKPDLLAYLGGIVRDLQGKALARVSFLEEFIAFLKKNGVDYDERYIWK